MVTIDTLGGLAEAAEATREPLGLVVAGLAITETLAGLEEAAVAFTVVAGSGETRVAVTEPLPGLGVALVALPNPLDFCVAPDGVTEA